ncbi:MAG: hypothetical protein JRI46_04790 [Deltaproteobacteria bacterium]|nr:hypothetical protein [Deltaproteobacteria bacterium]
MNLILNDIRDIEFNRIEYNKESDDYFEIIEGKIPVLLSAPHGAKHLRNGVWKGEDGYTSSTAIKLGELTGAHVIFVKNKTREDSNYLTNTRYKDVIRKFVDGKGIKFLADLHGADITRNYKINVGIIDKDNMEECSCPRLKPTIEESLRAIQDPLFNLDRFTAGSSGTVTYFAKHTCGIEAAQFEINARYRIIERKPDRSKAMNREEPDFMAEEKNVLELLRCLKEMVLRIKGKIEEAPVPSRPFFE